MKEWLQKNWVWVLVAVGVIIALYLLSRTRQATVTSQPAQPSTQGSNSSNALANAELQLATLKAQLDAQTQQRSIDAAVAVSNARTQAELEASRLAANAVTNGQNLQFYSQGLPQLIPVITKALGINQAPVVSQTPSQVNLGGSLDFIPTAPSAADINRITGGEPWSL